MGRIGKEQIFFLVTLLVVAFLAYGRISDPYATKRVAAGKRLEAAADQKPPLHGPEGALALEGWLERASTFEEPKEWTSLPPVDLPMPPLRDPASVRSAAEPSTGLAARGTYRARKGVRPHEFDSLASAASDDSESSGGASADVVAAGGRDSESLAGEESEFKKLYDWIEPRGTSKVRYGFLLDEDKYTLVERSEAPFVFQEVDPATRRLKTRMEWKREQLKDDGVHLADSNENQVEFLLRAIPRADRGVGSVSRVLASIEQALLIPTGEQYTLRRCEEELEHCLGLDPKSDRAYELLADVRRQRLDFEGELAALDGARSAGLRGPGFELRRARWFEHYGADEHALAILAQGAADFAASIPLRVEYGRALLRAGRGSEALAELESAERSASDRGDKRSVGIALALASLHLGKLDDAFRVAERQRAADDRDPEVHHLLASIEFARGNAASAIDHERAALGRSEDPAFRARATLGMALASIDEDRFDEALGLLAEVPNLDPLLRGAALRGKVDLFEATGHDDLALAAAHDSLDYEPRSTFGHYQYGRQLRRAGDLPGAREQLKLALSSGAVFSDLFTELGFTELQDGDAASAHRYFEESFAREARDPTKLLLARAQMVAGDLLLAQRTLQSAATSSGQVLAQAWCSYRTGEGERARQLLQGALNELRNAPPEDLDYARQCLDQILDVDSKQQWEDFVRWRGVANGWSFEQRFGLDSATLPGRFTISGKQRVGSGIEDWTYLSRPVERTSLHEFEVELSVGDLHQGRTGMGLVVFGGTLNEAPKPREALMLAVENGKLLQQKRSNMDDPEAVWKPIADLRAGRGEAVRLQIRRRQKGEAIFDFYLDGARVGEPVQMERWKGNLRGDFFALFFASAESGKSVESTLSYARLVQYRSEP